MATSLLVNPETRIASLVKLAVESHGLPVAAAFWLRRPEADYPSIALVIQLADKLGARDVYGRVMAVLDKETFVPKSFLLSRLAVFGERESKEAISALRTHSSQVAKIDNYQNVEIEEIPEATDIREDLRLDFLPGDSSAFPCIMLYRPIRYGGAIPPRTIQSESELIDILQSLHLRVNEQKRILDSLNQGSYPETVVYDIGLDTLYRLKLV